MTVVAKGRRRVTNDNAKRSLPPSSTYRLSPYDRSRQLSFDFEGALRELEDRRQWHPEGVARPARSFSSSRHRLVVSGYANQRRSVRPGRRPSLYSTVPIGVGFEVPKEVAVCVRRRQRREVLHALRKTGRRGQRRPRWRFYSRIRCS